jgi:RNA polymerase sigma factor (sigma-70 family)
MRDSGTPTGNHTEDEVDGADMRRLNDGHDAALNDLMSRHAEKLFNYLSRSLQNEEDAADLAQEAFVRVYQNRNRFDPKQRFSTWLYAIASNLVKDRFRWRTRHPQVSIDAESGEGQSTLGDTLSDPKASPIDAAQQEERSDTVRKAIAALPEELRTPLILAEYEEKPQAEIAEILGCSVKAVETRIYRARQRLRKDLASLLALT